LSNIEYAFLKTKKLISWVGKGWDQNMLGDVLYEGHGRTVGLKVLPNGKLEQTVTMHGMFLGEEFSSTWTSELEERPDKIVHNEFHGFFVTKSGEMGRYTGMGNGFLGPDGIKFRGTVCYDNPPGRFDWLNGTAIEWEIEIDQEGNINNKGWEGMEGE
jgi:hypothetical protein